MQENHHWQMDEPTWRVMGYSSEASWQREEEDLRRTFAEAERQFAALNWNDFRPLEISAADGSDAQPQTEPAERDAHPRRRPRATAEERRHLAGAIPYMLRHEPDEETLRRWLTNLAHVLNGHPAFDSGLDWTLCRANGGSTQ